ncbi:hypothetical protein DH2020_028250 [Rehmannia glutinosa]|uniref:Uncharacterized protein n=1 Tax=Rehmannia glutinosa TaxID=99300 RepID=A0ABR0VUV4_REHGL
MALHYKDLHTMLMKCDFLEEPGNKQESRSVVSVSALKNIKLPSAGVVDDHGVEETDKEGCTTPKAEDHKKINNVPLKCPPPPRKPKSLPSTKRKLAHHRESVLMLDLSNEIQSLFAPNILRDFMNGKIKKARKEEPPAKPSGKEG